MTSPSRTRSPLSTPIQATRPSTFEATWILCAAMMYPVAFRITLPPAESKRAGCTRTTSTSGALVTKL